MSAAQRSSPAQVDPLRRPCRGIGAGRRLCKLGPVEQQQAPPRSQTALRCMVLRGSGEEGEGWGCSGRGACSDTKQDTHLRGGLRVVVARARGHLTICRLSLWRDRPAQHRVRGAGWKRLGGTLPVLSRPCENSMVDGRSLIALPMVGGRRCCCRHDPGCLLRGSSYPARCI